MKKLLKSVSHQKLKWRKLLITGSRNMRELLKPKEHWKQSPSGLKQEGRKKMKLWARKLQKAVNNNTVF